MTKKLGIAMAIATHCDRTRKCECEWRLQSRMNEKGGGRRALNAQPSTATSGRRHRCGIRTAAKGRLHVARSAMVARQFQSVLMLAPIEACQSDASQHVLAVPDRIGFGSSFLRLALRTGLLT